jgi:hypothetical protein
MLLNPLLFDEDPVQSRQPSSGISIHRSPPPAEEFELTPADPAHKVFKTKLSVRFPQASADGLPSSFRLELGSQKVVLRRSADDPVVFSAAIDFDFETFAREQQRRADLANQGRMIPVFDGRQFVRMDNIQFLDPQEIRRAVELHQSLKFTPQILEGADFTIHPEKELMITDLSVVEDPTRTYDICAPNPQGKMGAWTFGKLMTDMRNQGDASQMVEDWLKIWTEQQTINGFPLEVRGRMQSRILDPWKKLPNGKLDLSEAPLRLLAIVNRIDLANPNEPAGEARFVFAMIDPTCPAGVTQLMVGFTVILEYKVPISGCNNILNWAKQWHDLGSLNLDGGKFNDQLQQITDQFATAGAGGSGAPNGSALAQLRTNEQALDEQSTIQWEMRQFQLNPNGGELEETTVAQTPDDSFNNNPLQRQLRDYINQFDQQILQGQYTVPDTYEGGHFLGASPHQTKVPMFWQSDPAPNDNNARRAFSANTCNGCHGQETDTKFVHVAPRLPGAPSTLSPFLIGSSGTLQNPGTENVPDPVDGTNHPYMELVRRETYMSTLLQNGCSAGGVLEGLASQPVNFVH